MEFIPTKFRDAWILQPQVWQDHRGFFLESFSEQWFIEKGIVTHFVQDNHSKSAAAGVLRGLHYQRPPHAQAKLVRVTHGAAYDVIVDLRRGSPTYGQWQGFELSETNFLMLFVPRGFAHGFCTLEDETEFMYKVDEYYSVADESGITWDDPTLNIAWPFVAPTLSEKDTHLEQFKNFSTPFIY